MANELTPPTPLGPLTTRLDTLTTPTQGPYSTLPSLSPGEHRLCLGVFLLMATASLYYWNAVLNTMYSVVVLKFPEYGWIPDTVTAVYSTVAFFSAAGLSYFGALNPQYILWGAVTLALMSILFPVTVGYVPGAAGATLLVVTGATAGVAEMFVQCSGYAIGVVLPRNYGGWISFGYGICGMMTFLLWMLFSQGIFKINNDSPSRDISAALWCHFGIAAVVNLTSATAFYFFQQKEFLIQTLIRVRGDSLIQAEPRSTHPPPSNHSNHTIDSHLVVINENHSMSWWEIFRESWVLQVSMAFLMGMSMMAYPNIGPYGWRLKIRQNDILTGIFQSGDFIGRYVPNIWSGFLFPKRVVVPLTWLRIVMLILFIVIKHTDTVLSSYPVQCVLMASLSLTHGWYASIYMSRIPQALESPADKSRAGSMAVMLLVAAIAIGLWLAKLA